MCVFMQNYKISVFLLSVNTEFVFFFIIFIIISISSVGI